MSYSRTFFQPSILQPTRITNHSATFIDNIFFNSIDHSIISGNIVYDLTDHLPNFIIIDKCLDVSDHKKVYKRDYSKVDDDFKYEISRVNWEHVLYPHSDLSDMFNRFFHKLPEITYKHVIYKI